MKSTAIVLSLILIGLSLWLLGQYDSNLHLPTLVQKLVQRTISTDRELENLKEIYLLLNKAYEDSTPPSLVLVTKILDVIQSINPNVSSGISSPVITQVNNYNSEVEVLDVCPEQWFPEIDYPHFQKGFVTANCKNVRPLSDVISLVINFYNTYECEIHLPNILSGLKTFYPTIRIYIPGNIFPTCSATKGNSVIPVPVKTSWKPGKIWNRLIAAATTPYVFIGRDLNYFDNFSQVERQIRMISYTSDIVIAGGSIRNLSGHWQVGCYQSKLQNYILEYLNGYYISRNECMFCDHLLGSFVTTKALLQKVPFDNDLPSSMVFEDFFLKVKASRLGSVVNCPDAMYFSTNAYEDKRVNDRLLWQPLAKKWELNRIFLPRDVKHSYSCPEIGINDCKRRVRRQTKFFLLPVCCLEQFGRMVKIFHDFCVKNNVFYEYSSGSVLGGVKVGGRLPWDIDGDCFFYKNNFSLFSISKELFRSSGIVLDHFKVLKKRGKNGYFLMNSPDLNIEMWGYDVFSKDLYLPSLFKDTPTKILIHHTWAYTQVSPGLYARNRYGQEILKHSNSWKHLKMKHSWVPYSPGSFLPCPTPQHHACQSHFSADGNLQFYIP